MANLGGFHALGHFLAGGNAPQAALAEAQGEQLGANTENAIAQAQDRIRKNAGLEKGLPAALAALYPDHPEVARALTVGGQTGIPMEQITGSRLQDQQFNNRGTVRDLTQPHSDRVAAAQAIDPASLGNALNTNNAAHIDAETAETNARTHELIPAQAKAALALAGLNATKDKAGGFAPNAYSAQSPEEEALLTRLINAGVIDPSRVTRYNTNPMVLHAAGASLDSGNYNPGLHAANTLQAQEKGFTSNTPSSPGGRLRAGSAVTSHIKMLQGLADAQDANDLPIAQKLYTAITGQAGSDFPTMNRLASDFVGRELDGFLSAGNPTLQGHTEAAGHFNQNEIGAQQLRSNVAFGKKLMGGQYAALKQEYASAPGRTPQDVKNFSNRFMGGNRDILDEFEREHGEIVPGMPNSVAAPAPGAPLPAAAPASQVAGGGGLPVGWTVAVH